MVGADERLDDDGNPQPDVPPRPAYATGRIGLSIPPLRRALDVVATPSSEAVEPGSDTTVTVEVSDADRNPVSGADVAIVVVDEAVLSLTGYDLADPLDVFYADIWSNLSSEYMRSSILLARADQVTADSEELGRATADTGAPATSDAGGEDGRPRNPRTSTGTTRLPGRRPNRSTCGATSTPSRSMRHRNRPMAKARSPSTSHSPTTSPATASWRWRSTAPHDSARASRRSRPACPLQVRPSAPRFLNFGDEFELPIVLQNQTDEALEVDLAVQTSNLEAHRAGRPDGHGAGQRPSRGEVPGRGRRGGNRPAPGRRGERRVHRCHRDRTARLHTVDRRGVRDLRRDRRGCDRATDGRPDRRVPAVRRPRDQHVVDGAPGADRRGAVPRRLSLRVGRRPGVAHHGDRHAARRARRVRRRRLAERDRARCSSRARSRRAGRTPERRRRLAVLAARSAVDPVGVDSDRPMRWCSPSRPATTCLLPRWTRRSPTWRRSRSSSRRSTATRSATR